MKTCASIGGGHELCGAPRRPVRSVYGLRPPEIARWMLDGGVAASRLSTTLEYSAADTGERARWPVLWSAPDTWRWGIRDERR
jgi:hypothetical protein